MSIPRLWQVLVLSAVACGLRAAGAAEEGPAVTESAREIPIAYQVDVVVVGGSSGAVTAACEAARNGARVFLAAPRSFFLHDKQRVGPAMGAMRTSSRAL